MTLAAQHALLFVAAEAMTKELNQILDQKWNLKQARAKYEAWLTMEIKADTVIMIELCIYGAHKSIIRMNFHVAPLSFE